MGFLSQPFVPLTDISRNAQYFITDVFHFKAEHSDKSTVQTYQMYPTDLWPTRKWEIFKITV